MSHIVIENISPVVDGSRHPVKHVLGVPIVIEADIYRDGHQKLKAAVCYRSQAAKQFSRRPMLFIDNDRWRGEFVPPENALYYYTIEAWTDYFASWIADSERKLGAGRDIGSDVEELLRYVESLKRTRNPGADFGLGELDVILERLRETAGLSDSAEILALLCQSPILETLERLDQPCDVMQYRPPFELIVDRPKASFSAWYEMFPRSQSREPGKPSTLREAASRLVDIAEMGFDVVYLTPIHPIGRTNRKGPNNSLTSDPSSPGSPWAIGNADGGHDAIDPALGDLRDFDHFIAAASALGMETAMDLAFQCSPDHPWVDAHPDWFEHHPDGSLKFAENPPKLYQDVCPLNFDTYDYHQLALELRRIVEFWIRRGVTIFRVDNPHTKPLGLWQFLISSIHERRPDIIFLAEAFTRPKVMYGLAKVGFTQSYTYFTWRNTKAELIDYLTELVHPDIANYFRGNFFVNTPDILPTFLQTGGVAAFKLRLTLAATLAPSYGIYSGFELCENEALPDSEEYNNAEKYQINFRDWRRAGNIRDYISLINLIRKTSRALQTSTNLVFLPTDNDQIICYCRYSTDRENILLIAVNLDPHHPHHCTVQIPLALLNLPSGQTFSVIDLLTGATYRWSDRNYVRLDPELQPAHILRVEKSL